MRVKNHRQTVLITDDDAAVREILAEILSSQGYEILQADSGEAALAIAGSRRIDAFLLDMEMPKTNGIQICLALRRLDEYQSTPIIFITGTGE